MVESFEFQAQSLHPIDKRFPQLYMNYTRVGKVNNSEFKQRFVNNDYYNHPQEESDVVDIK